MAAGRFIYVLGIIVLIAGILGLALFWVGDFMPPMPSICADYSSPSLAPAECHKTNVIIYIAALMALSSGVGYLWRKLGQ